MSRIQDRPNRESRPSTVYDVARRAGVSHTTVIRLLRGYEGIGPTTRARVEQALRDLDYKPNLSARSLITGRSHRIGALTHQIDQVGPRQIVQGASAAARAAGYVLDIVTLDMDDIDSIRMGMKLFDDSGLAGLVILSSTDEMREALDSTSFRVPVYFSGEQKDPSQDDPEEDQAIEDLVEHLVHLGHHYFFHIGGAPNWPAGRNRHHAYQSIIERREVSSVGSAYGDWSAESGYEIGMAIPSHVTAVVAANDQMAIGAMLALRRRGYDIPGDVSVTGMDDIPEAAFLWPPLTTVRLDSLTWGALAVKRLLSKIEGTGPADEAPERPTMIVRESTGPAPTDRR
jgi:DNA-binding LacI/PurR family transcriptional regulator